MGFAHVAFVFSRQRFRLQSQDPRGWEPVPLDAYATSDDRTYFTDPTRVVPAVDAVLNLKGNTLIFPHKVGHFDFDFLSFSRFSSVSQATTAPLAPSGWSLPSMPMHHLLCGLPPFSSFPFAFVFFNAAQIQRPSYQRRTDTRLFGGRTMSSKHDSLGDGIGCRVVWVGERLGAASIDEFRRWRVPTPLTRRMVPRIAVDVGLEHLWVLQVGSICVCLFTCLFVCVRVRSMCVCVYLCASNIQCVAVATVCLYLANPPLPNPLR